MNTKKIFYFLFLSLFSIQFASPLYAQPISSYFYPAGNLPQANEQGIIAQFLGPLISLVPIITGLAAFFTILLAGIRYVTHAGNAAETKKASDMLTYALIGLGLSALAFGLTRFLFRIGGAQGLF